jgi:hypothetical protein
MLLIVMNTSTPEGWSDVKYKSFRVRDDSSSESGSDSDDEDLVQKVKGYDGQKYKKILEVEELIPE